MLHLIFPRKCVLCRKLLSKTEQHLCRNCHIEQPEFHRAKRNIPFIAHWSALWYYKEKVRPSILRYKFYGSRNYASRYADLMAARLEHALADRYDLLTWVPVSRLRSLRRGYDQAALLAKALGKRLGTPAVRTLRKIRHTPPQSGIRETAQRKANVLGAYRVTDPKLIQDKRILLIDDVVTTGATASECAKTLLLAGANKVIFAALAAADNDKK